MHQIRRIITVAQLHVFRRVLLDVRGIVRPLGLFVQLLGLKLVLKLPNYIILHVNQFINVHQFSMPEVGKNPKN